MKILITGSSGFVGSHLIKLLSPKNTVVQFDLKRGQNVLNLDLLSKKMAGVDVVVHLAAFISASESWEKPFDYMENNSLGTLNVINAGIAQGVKKIIVFSSAAVKAKPYTPYAVSKMSAEAVTKLYSDKIDTVIVRPENIYGLGQKSNYGYVIHSFIDAVKSGRNIAIYGDGNQSRDFIYIDDVTKTVDKLLQLNIKSGTILSLGTGKSTKINDLAKLVMVILKKKAAVSYLEKRKEPTRSYSNTNLLKEIGIDPDKFTQLKQGIKNLIYK